MKIKIEFMSWIGGRAALEIKAGTSKARTSVARTSKARTSKARTSTARNTETSRCGTLARSFSSDRVVVSAARRSCISLRTNRSR